MTTIQQAPSRIIRDAEATEKEAGETLLWITVIGMVASLFAAGVSGWVLSGHDVPTTIKLILGAVAIDLLLFRWLRMSARLRRIGAVTTRGKVLDVGGVAMTYYFSALSGICMLVPAESDLAWGLMAVTYLFIPTVMWLSYITIPAAQQLLKDAADRATAEVERARREAVEAQRAEDRNRERLTHEGEQTRNRKATTESTERTETAKAERARADADVTINRERIAASVDSLRKCLTILFLTGARLDNAQAVLERAERNAVARLRRQVDRQRTASEPPANRQPKPPADRQRRRQPTASAGPANTLSVDELVALATATGDTLAVALAMGRGALAVWLAERAGGGRVSDHKTREVMARIQPGSNITSLSGAAGGHR